MTRLTDALAPGMRAFVSSMSGESALLREELTADGERARGVTFTGIQFPGIDRTDYLALHPEARQLGFFMTPSLRAGMAQGRAELVGADYLGIARFLTDAPPFDAAMAQLSLPDAEGYCRAGVAVDFLPLVWARAKKRIAHLNPQMPRTRGSFRVHVSELDVAVEADRPLLTFEEPSPGEVETRIGQHVAGLLREGDTLQFGVGSVPSALGGALAAHRKLKLHSGMVTPSLLKLWDAGALDRSARLVAGVALGDAGFYSRLGALENLWFTGVNGTHDVAAIAQIPRFCAINTALEVDLLGQANAERANGVLKAGPGGLPAYARGAQASPGGRLLICLPSTAKNGSISRIVPVLGDEALCTVPRYLADVIVTEHGVAEVRGLSLDARADALIKIAAPSHRPALGDAWAALRRRS